MSCIVLAGFSNSGKSTSLRYLPPEETFIININNKQLAIPGFRKNYMKIHKEDVLDKEGKPVMIVNEGENAKKKKHWVGNYYQSDNYGKIHNVLNIVDLMRNVKYLVVDDINYLLGQDTMAMATTASREKYSTFAYNYNNILHRLMTMREDIQVIIISHLMKEEDTGFVKMISNSKMLDKSICIDGLFNYIIYAERLVDELDGSIQYKFRTRTNGYDTCRSTSGCFKDLYIEPNIKACIDRINAFEMGDEEPEYEEAQKPLELSEKKETPKEDAKKDLDDVEI